MASGRWLLVRGSVVSGQGFCGQWPEVRDQWSVVSGERYKGTVASGQRYERSVVRGQRSAVRGREETGGFEYGRGTSRDLNRGLCVGAQCVVLDKSTWARLQDHDTCGLALADLIANQVELTTSLCRHSGLGAPADCRPAHSQCGGEGGGSTPSTACTHACCAWR